MTVYVVIDVDRNILGIFSSENNARSLAVKENGYVEIWTVQ